MKHYKSILTLLFFSLAIGCSRSAPETKKTNSKPSAKSSKKDRDKSSVDKPRRKSPVDPAAESKKVQADVRKIINAVYKGDADTVLEHTHPKIIKLLGGKAKAKKAAEKKLSQLLAAGLKAESLTFPKDPTFLKTKENHFAIVPTLSIIAVKGQRIESSNFQLGIKPVGTSKWTYIGGSRVNRQNVRTLFPDFPSDFVFPEYYRRTL